MSLHRYAKVLGKRGGQVRARRLSTEKRKKIAVLGGRARAESFKIAKRIEDNFRYLEAIWAMTASQDL